MCVTDRKGSLSHAKGSNIGNTTSKEHDERGGRGIVRSLSCEDGEVRPVPT